MHIFFQRRYSLRLAMTKDENRQNTKSLFPSYINNTSTCTRYFVPKMLLANVLGPQARLLIGWQKQKTRRPVGLAATEGAGQMPERTITGRNKLERRGDQHCV